eukprot:CAMPEP_0198263292 /NCGR_PEP_ID=MMETSP1447-20131203/11661_1 /TAXON_ID=420782 /ORGANISM="Chaetoceros dichaeta, Strain CCMP1751" /LENGTH=313 /DNA_ID=CAMNT_0043951829 /DNA_START=32 /DNA_END=973 /DNA_ORIENTATION=-
MDYDTNTDTNTDTHYMDDIAISCETDSHDDDEIELIICAKSTPNARPNSKRVSTRKLTRFQKLKRKKPTELPTLYWHNFYPVIPSESENALLPILFPLGKFERGSMKTQPSFRVKIIMKSCEEHGMQLEQALSLRRQHMKLFNPHVGDMNLGLGESKDISITANLFKQAVLKYLKKQQLHLEAIEQTTDNMISTPDFMLRCPVRMITHQIASEDSNFGEHGQINWIEAEMSYGASTVHCESSSSVDTVMYRARNYVKSYGPGAFIFAYGCGSKLRAQLRALGISVLDSHPLDLKKVKKHQMTWCANKDGVILP